MTPRRNFYPFLSEHCGWFTIHLGRLVSVVIPGHFVGNVDAAGSHHWVVEARHALVGHLDTDFPIRNTAQNENIAEICVCVCERMGGRGRYQPKTRRK